jgi:hypothetical protein
MSAYTSCYYAFGSRRRRILYRLRCFRYKRMLRLKFMMVNMSLSISMAAVFFLVLSQIAIVYGATSSLPSSLSQSIGSSATVQKVAQLGAPVFLAPIAASANNVYITWSSSKTGGDFEVMFRASIDNGQTFGPKINLSNTTGVDSLDPSIAASGNNVYVSWWERANQTSNEPVMIVSNDNGQTFGKKIMLSNATFPGT